MQTRFKNYKEFLTSKAEINEFILDLSEKVVSIENITPYGRGHELIASNSDLSDKIIDELNIRELLI